MCVCVLNTLLYQIEEVSLYFWFIENFVRDDSCFLKLYFGPICLLHWMIQSWKISFSACWYWDYIGWFSNIEQVLNTRHEYNLVIVLYIVFCLLLVVVVWWNHNVYVYKKYPSVVFSSYNNFAWALDKILALWKEQGIFSLISWFCLVDMLIETQ